MSETNGLIEIKEPVHQSMLTSRKNIPLAVAIKTYSPHRGVVRLLGRK